MKKERLFQVIGMMEDRWIKEAEDEMMIQRKPMQLAAVRKWSAAAAGILLIAGAGVLYLHQNRSLDSTTSLNNSAMSATGAGMDNSRKMEKIEMNYSGGEEAIEYENSLETNKSDYGSKDEMEYLDKANQESLYDADGTYDSKIVLYADIIKEIYQYYQDYQNGDGILYLNLDDGMNLDKVQKERLLEVLDSKYGIVTMSGSFEELCEQGLIYAEAEKISGIYLSFEVTKEEENCLAFQIDCWGGRNVVDKWENCYAFYEEDGWRYEVGD